MPLDSVFFFVLFFVVFFFFVFFFLFHRTSYCFPLFPVTENSLEDIDET